MRRTTKHPKKALQRVRSIPKTVPNKHTSQDQTVIVHTVVPLVIPPSRSVLLHKKASRRFGIFCYDPINTFVTHRPTGRYTPTPFCDPPAPATNKQNLSVSRHDYHLLSLSDRDFLLLSCGLIMAYQQLVAKKCRYWLRTIDHLGHPYWLALPKDAFGTDKEDTYLWSRTLDDKGRMHWVQLLQPPSFLLPFQSHWDFLPIVVKDKIHQYKQSYEVKDALKRWNAMGWGIVHRTIADLPLCHVFFLFPYIGILFFSSCTARENVSFGQHFVHPSASTRTLANPAPGSSLTRAPPSSPSTFFFSFFSYCFPRGFVGSFTRRKTITTLGNTPIFIMDTVHNSPRFSFLS